MTNTKTKSKLSLLILLILSLFLSAFLFIGHPVTASAAEGELTVTEAVDSDGDGYVEIDSAAKLWWFTQQVNGGNNSLNAELTANIDLAGTCGDGIGNWKPISHKNGYTGNFNGQGFTISNLYISNDSMYVGLFGYVKGATIENVTVTGSIYSTADIDGYDSAASGGIVGYLKGGIIRNCHVNMTVSGEMNIGGICGTLDSNGVIENCTSRGSVIHPGVSEWSGQALGGIVSYIWDGATVQGCTNYATVSSLDGAYMGGIAAFNYGTIENCFNYSNLISHEGVYDALGGIAKCNGNGGIIRNCGNHGNISGFDVGGIVCQNIGAIENCYNVGAVSGTSGNFVGPISGLNQGDGTTTNNYYLSETTTEDGGRTAEQFASGQVAYELNGSTTTDESVWKQTLGTDSYPTLAGENVYYVTSKKCDGTVIGQIYSNSSKDVIVHEDTDNDSFCDLCNWLIITEITFPDANFRTYITENIDTDKDGLLSPEESGVVSSLGIANKNISDLTGIEYFTELTELEAENNNFTTLDLSGLSKLEMLVVDYNFYLASLNLEGCSSLLTLYLSGCHALASLNMQDCTALTNLNVENCFGLANSLDVSPLTELTYLNVYGIYLFELDLSNNTKLENLLIGGTGLTSLDLSNNTELYWLDGDSLRSIEHCGVGYVNMNLYGDVTKMININGGTMGNDGWLKLNENATKITYEYVTGADGCNLSVTIGFNPYFAEQHSYVEQPVSKDETGHYAQSCSTCRTVNEESVVAHTIKYDYTKEYTNSQHREYCTDCGYYVIETCTYSSECNEVCSECNLTTRLFPDWSVHSFVYTTYEDGDDDSSNDSHSATCEDCGAYIGEFCTYEFACSETCVCGRANPDAVAHTEKLVYNDDGTHDKVCSVCAKVVEENVGHAYVYTASDNVITETCNADGCPYSATATLNAAENAVYDGDHNQATVAYSENWVGGTLTVTYSGTANDGTAYTGVPVKAGEVTASITFGGATASVNYIVAKATNEWTETPSIQGWTYGEYGNDPTATPKFGEMNPWSFSYRVKGEVAWTNNPPSDAGIYEMRARVQATDNWELLETTIEFEIKKATPTADTFDFTPPTNLNICDGLAKEATVTVKEGIEGVGSVTIKYFKDETELSGAPTTVGTYTVKIEVAEGANYNSATLTDEAWTFTFDITDEAAHKNVTLVSNGNETHDKLCSACEKVIESGIACSGTTTDDCDKGYKCSCGGYFGTKEHDFSGDYLSDADGHWHECKACGATDTKLAHTPDDDDGSCLTAILCSACGYETTKGYMIHNFNNANLYDSEGHWHKCERCDVTAAKYDHSFTVSQKDGTHHWNKCEECDATDTKTLHTFNVLETDDTDHWHKCSGCDATDTKVKHSATEDGDCKTEEKCSCGAVVIEAKDDHDFDNACDTDCNNDGCEYTRTTEHIPEADDGDCTTDILCSICDAIMTEGKENHIGGTATCTAQAICEVCETAYGEIDASNHVKTTFVYTANADGEAHTKKYECCGVVALDNEAHAYGADNKCVCGAEKPIPTYTVTVENGTASDGNTSIVVNENGSVTVTANAAPEGKRFKGWAVNGAMVSAEQSYTFTATADTTITAVYEDIPKNSGWGWAIGVGGSIVAVALIGLAVFLFKKKKA